MATQTIEEFVAQISGTVDALVLAFGGLVALHPEPQKPLALLHSILEAANEPASGTPLSPQRKAYLAGTTAAVARLAQAAKLAQDVQAMNQSGPKQ